MLGTFCHVLNKKTSKIVSYHFRYAINEFNMNIAVISDDLKPFITDKLPTSKSKKTVGE